MAKRSLELKVGLFLVISLAILIGFLFILGNFDFGDGHALYVNYENAAGLRNGAKVKISGVAAGKVKEIAFLGGEELSVAGQPVFVRVRLEVTPEMAGTLTEGSRFYISTEGVLGEKYIEVTPGPVGGPQLAVGAVVDGETPVELQVLTAKAAQMMDQVQAMVEGERGELESLGESLREIVDRTRSITRTVDDELPRVVADARETLEQARKSLSRMDELVADGRELIARPDGVTEAVGHASRVTARLEADLPELVDELSVAATEARVLLADSRNTLGVVEEELAQTTRDARKVLRRADRTMAQVDVGDLVPELRAALTRLVTNFSHTGELLNRLASRTDTLVADLSEVTTDVRAGKGTVGALLRDREVYDDLRELILDLKRNPWKVMWKP